MTATVGHLKTFASGGGTPHPYGQVVRSGKTVAPTMTEPPSSFALELVDPDATRALGRALGAALEPGLVVALTGDLGAGKTALSKAAVAAQGGVDEDDVVSPTFIIAGESPGRVEVLHVDAYRLGGPGDLEALGYELDRQEVRAVLVEWAERVLDALPEDRLSVALEHAGERRRMRAQASGPRSRRALAAWARAAQEAGLRADRGS